VLHFVAQSVTLVYGKPRPNLWTEGHCDVSQNGWTLWRYLLIRKKKISWKCHFLEVVFLHYTTILLREIFH